ncbi:innexin inx2 [Trichonephila inaurata madagascariensis]|uniref:Innexin n=1 Tax=Trichonephila inaurata madagascariensis TaxID=2747483 RepID=A0A8X6XBC6_9ARAC|nr:innexin inx2 [Trichonephila inaurata madagascariensis]
MDKLFLSGTFKNFIKPRIFVTDGTTFRLHYRLTALLLTVGSILVSATQFYGDPIQCIQSDDVPKKVLDTFCWVEGTFTLPKALNKEVGLEVVYPGVDQKDPGDEVVYHAYYQWVCFVLLLQAAMFYLPRLVWRTWEGGRLKNLLQQLNKPVLDHCQKKQCCDHLVRYFRTNMRHHSSYAYKYLLCELMNLVNVIGQIYFVDYFLGGEFTTYGVDVLHFTVGAQENRTDPMVRVFPRLTKCLFHRFGPSGDVQKYDSLCLLPLNIVNEKIYILLWFWLIILSVCSAISILYKVLLLSSRTARYYALHSIARLTPKDHLKKIVRKTSYGDWFVFFLLAQNMDVLNFRNILADLHKDFELPLLNNEGNEVSTA